MRKWKLIALTFLAGIAVIAIYFGTGDSRFQVIGTLSDADATAIRELIRRDIRAVSGWSLSIDSLLSPRIAARNYWEYRAQRILWAEVHSPTDVSVFVGTSKSVIKTQGWHFTFHRAAQWEVTGSSYWGFPEVAPGSVFSSAARFTS